MLYNIFINLTWLQVDDYMGVKKNPKQVMCRAWSGVYKYSRELVCETNK